MREFNRFCKTPELIENYELAKADNFKGWQCHHRFETHNSDGERRLVDISVKELKALGMYYNRPPEELIFMRRVEHVSLHHKGKVVSEETKNKMHEAMKGKPKSEEWKKKHSEAMKGKKLPPRSEEHRRKLSEAMKGKPKSEEWKKKHSEAMKGKNKGQHWKIVDRKRVYCLAILLISITTIHAKEVKAYDQCSGTYKTYTSEMDKKIKVNESKLTSLRYLKKICKITDTYKGEDYIAYELDNGKGKFLKVKGGKKVCLLVIDDELYGRWVELSSRGVAVTYNLHDKRCHQRTHSESVGNWTYTYYLTTDALENHAEILKARMLRLSDTWGLKY